MPRLPDYEEILDNLYDGVYFVDRDRVISYWNKGSERITGYSAEDVVGRSCRDGILNHVDAAGRSLCANDCPLAATMEDGVPRSADVFLHHAEGHRLPVMVRCAPLHDDDGTIIGAVESFSADQGTQATRAALHELRRAVRTDPLTGIGNRTFVEGRLRAVIAEYAPQPDQAAVVMVDVDHFKSVNDRYGHDVGDRVLRMVATTLRQNLRASDAFGRWGGEEFVGILRDVNDPVELRAICDKLRVLVARSSLHVGDAMVAVTISLGATLLRPGDTPASVTARADELLYESKRNGRNRTTVAGADPGPTA